MKKIILFSLFISLSSSAALSIKPGLWTVETKVKKDGKEYDPQAKMREAMAKMSPEQKKQMEAMVAKMSEKMGQKNSAAMGSIGITDQGMQICYTEKMLENEELITKNKHQQDCETTFPVKTSTRVVTEFKCKNGSSGTAEWNVKDSTHYQGAVKMTTAKGEKAEVNYVASFTSSDCGKHSKK